jgi:hypothetical protein
MLRDVEPWRAWDATDDEYAELQIIREPIPETLSDTIDHWLYQWFAGGSRYGAVHGSLVNELTAALRVMLPQGLQAMTLVETVREEGDRYTLQVVDYLLAKQRAGGVGMPDNVQVLSDQMDRSSSAVRIVLSDDFRYRIARRMPEGVEEAAQRAIDDANATAGRHLTTAWHEIQSLAPDASKVLRESIQAVEAAGGPVVIPNDKRPQLSKIVGALKQQQGWGLVLAQRDDGHPDHAAVLIGMLETLAFAEQHRHSGHGYSEAEAIGHVQLAATLVGWFSAAVVVRNP